MKRWNYFAVFSPGRFFSATLADLGYAGNIFVYTLDFESGQLHEEGLVIPLSKGSDLANGTTGTSNFDGKGVRLHFQSSNQAHQIQVDWPAFDDDRGISADLLLSIPPEQQSMNITIPIRGNAIITTTRSTACRPAESCVMAISPKTLHPGYHPWASWIGAAGCGNTAVSGIGPALPDSCRMGAPIGLNLGCGFGDTSAATENAILLNGRVHKLDQVTFEYNPKDYMQPWKFRDNHKRLTLDFIPFKDRLATTHLGMIDSVVHQMFGRYSGFVVTDGGEKIDISTV